MDSKLKFISMRKARAEEEKVNTHKQVQRLGFRDSAIVKQLRQIEADMVQDSKSTIWGVQDRGAVQGRSESWQYVVVHRRGGREARLARGGWGVLQSWNEGPSRDWAWWRLDGWGLVRPRHRDGECGVGPSLAITAIFKVFFRIYLCMLAFCLDKRGCRRTSVLCTHIHES